MTPAVSLKLVMLLIALKSQREKFNLSSVDHEPICYFINAKPDLHKSRNKEIVGSYGHELSFGIVVYGVKFFAAVFTEVIRFSIPTVQSENYS